MVAGVVADFLVVYLQGKEAAVGQKVVWDSECFWTCRKRKKASASTGKRTESLVLPC
jgi:hypothetical protein